LHLPHFLSGADSVSLFLQTLHENAILIALVGSWDKFVSL
jgi:hypothetical protein